MEEHTQCLQSLLRAAGSLIEEKTPETWEAQVVELLQLIPDVFAAAATDSPRPTTAYLRLLSSCLPLHTLIRLAHPSAGNVPVCRTALRVFARIVSECIKLDDVHETLQNQLCDALCVSALVDIILYARHVDPQQENLSQYSVEEVRITAAEVLFVMSAALDRVRSALLETRGALPALWRQLLSAPPQSRVATNVAALLRVLADTDTLVFVEEYETRKGKGDREAARPRTFVEDTCIALPTLIQNTLSLDGEKAIILVLDVLCVSLRLHPDVYGAKIATSGGECTVALEQLLVSLQQYGIAMRESTITLFDTCFSLEAAQCQGVKSANLIAYKVIANPLFWKNSELSFEDLMTLYRSATVHAATPRLLDLLTHVAVDSILPGMLSVLDRTRGKVPTSAPHDGSLEKQGLMRAVVALCCLLVKDAGVRATVRASLKAPLARTLLGDAQHFLQDAARAGELDEVGPLYDVRGVFLNCRRANDTQENLELAARSLLSMQQQQQSTGSGEPPSVGDPHRSQRSEMDAGTTSPVLTYALFRHALNCSLDCTFREVDAAANSTANSGVESADAIPSRRDLTRSSLHPSADSSTVAGATKSSATNATKAPPSSYQQWLHKRSGLMKDKAASQRRSGGALTELFENGTEEERMSLHVMVYLCTLLGPHYAEKLKPTSRSFVAPSGAVYSQSVKKDTSHSWSLEDVLPGDLYAFFVPFHSLSAERLREEIDTVAAHTKELRRLLVLTPITQRKRRFFLTDLVNDVLPKTDVLLHELLDIVERYGAEDVIHQLSVCRMLEQRQHSGPSDSRQALQDAEVCPEEVKKLSMTIFRDVLHSGNLIYSISRLRQRYQQQP